MQMDTADLWHSNTCSALSLILSYQQISVPAEVNLAREMGAVQKPPNKH